MTFIEGKPGFTFSDYVRKTKIGDIFWYGSKPYRRGRGIIYTALDGMKDPTINRAFKKRYSRRLRSSGPR